VGQLPLLEQNPPKKNQKTTHKKQKKKKEKKTQKAKTSIAAAALQGWPLIGYAVMPNMQRGHAAETLHLLKRKC